MFQLAEPCGNSHFSEKKTWSVELSKASFQHAFHQDRDSSDPKKNPPRKVLVSTAAIQKGRFFLFFNLVLKPRAVRPSPFEVFLLLVSVLGLICRCEDHPPGANRQNKEDRVLAWATFSAFQATAGCQNALLRFYNLYIIGT